MPERLETDVSEVPTDDSRDRRPHVRLAQGLLNGVLWGGRLVMLYQLYGLLRDNRAHSHPPLLSLWWKGRAQRAATQTLQKAVLL